MVDLTKSLVIEPMKLEKPLLRGRFHEAAASISLGASLMLLDLSRSVEEFFILFTYCSSLFGLFLISALYHRVQWSVEKRSFMRRLDHSAIFALIAGTMTAVFYLALPREMAFGGIRLIWSVAAIGMIQSIVWVNAPKWLAAVLYVGAGWLGFPYLKDMHHVLGAEGEILILVGGLTYTLGAFVYAFKKPNPWPKAFGYHEIFHILVAIAAALHFILIKGLID